MSKEYNVAFVKIGKDIDKNLEIGFFVDTKTKRLIQIEGKGLQKAKLEKLTAGLIKIIRGKRAQEILDQLRPAEKKLVFIEEEPKAPKAKPVEATGEYSCSMDGNAFKWFITVLDAMPGDSYPGFYWRTNGIEFKAKAKSDRFMIEGFYAAGDPDIFKAYSHGGLDKPALISNLKELKKMAGVSLPTRPVKNKVISLFVAGEKSTVESEGKTIKLPVLDDIKEYVDRLNEHWELFNSSYQEIQEVMVSSFKERKEQLLTKAPVKVVIDSKPFLDFMRSIPNSVEIIEVYFDDNGLNLYYSDWNGVRDTDSQKKIKFNLSRSNRSEDTNKGHRVLMTSSDVETVFGSMPITANMKLSIFNEWPLAGTTSNEYGSKTRFMVTPITL